MAAIGVVDEEDMLEEEGAKSPATTTVSKEIWRGISYCLPRSTVTIVKLRVVL